MEIQTWQCVGICLILIFMLLIMIKMQHKIDDLNEENSDLSKKNAVLFNLLGECREVSPDEIFYFKA